MSFVLSFKRLSPRSCSCGNSLGISADSGVLTIQKSRHSIVISQAPSGTFSAHQFAYVLRDIRFAHDPVRPPVDQYSAYVSVSAYDGVFPSPLAFTRVDVFIVNIAPSVLINGQTNTGAMMFDGDIRIPIFQSDNVLILEDSLTIQEVSITLTNPADVDERLLVSPPPTHPTNNYVTSNGATVILFTGPASPADFSQALTETTILFEYPPMQSILQAERINLEDR